MNLLIPRVDPLAALHKKIRIIEDAVIEFNRMSRHTDLKGSLTAFITDITNLLDGDGTVTDVAIPNQLDLIQNRFDDDWLTLEYEFLVFLSDSLTRVLTIACEAKCWNPGNEAVAGFCTDLTELRNEAALLRYIPLMKDVLDEWEAR